MTRRTTFLMALALAAVIPATLRGDESTEFVSLFNGKDLTGWITPDNKELFTVENGEIVGRTKGDLKKNEFLVVDKPYGDFVLKVKVKLRNHNSGIQFRSERKLDGAVAGPQADAANGYWGLLYEERGRGKLDQYAPDLAEKLIHKNDWNDFEISAQGDHVTILINGTKVIDRVDPKFAKTGVIGFQVHVGEPMEVRFKDVKIKTLH